jgi:hypothetical protein
MKPITFQEWETKFYRRVFSGPVASGEVTLDEDEGFTFYDTGAVKDSEGDFIVKLDQISEK